jgi:hypothetical protein
MRAAHRDRFVGSLLLVFAAAWTATVYLTVPVGFGDSIGPRAFPLYLGVALVALSGLMVLGSFRHAGATDEEEGESVSRTTRTDLRMAGSVFAIIVAYGFLMQKTGFVIATLAIVAAMMWLVLGVRKPVPIAAMAVGIAFGCWLIFGEILGAYLPPGTWISLN